MQYNNNGTNRLDLINDVSQSEWQDTQVDNFDQSVHFEPAIPQSNLAEIPALRAQSGRDKEKFNRRYRQVQLYIDALINCKSRLLVLRIDLGYHKEIAHNTSAEQAMADLNHLMNNRRGNPRLFGDMVGYIRKTEWSAEKGIHFHMIIFFDGQQRQKDTYWTQAIGEYWQQVTGLRGVYWNCNDKRNNDYVRYGIGMVEHHDLEKRKILLEDVAKYLTKVEQQPPQYYSASGRDRLFAMGAMPKERTSDAGRPREGVV